ncbi:MAG TPA: hypothetical protein VHE54_01180 [Puia sp.]|nr:hypothetical protein [Puia sp.]
MSPAEFDQRFQELFTDMVTIAFEYVDSNKAEVDEVYVYCSMEKGNLFYNVFYRINGQLVEMHRVNTVSSKQYDVSDDRMFRLLDQGKDDVRETERLFKEAGREVPTEMRMVYSPKTGAFNNDINYDLHYTNHPTKTISDVFEEWYAALGGKIA